MKVYVKWAIRDESRQDDVMRCDAHAGMGYTIPGGIEMGAKDHKSPRRRRAERVAGEDGERRRRNQRRRAGMRMRMRKQASERVSRQRQPKHSTSTSKQGPLCVLAGRRQL